MSSKRARRSLLLRRGAAGLLAGGLATTLVVVYIDRSGHHVTTVEAGSTHTTVATGPTVAALDGTYNVTITVVNADYGVTWPGPQLTDGQQLTQRWTIVCKATSCKLTVANGHVAEDPDGASMQSTNNTNFVVSSTAPATTDDPALPAGCGGINQIDVQKLTLDAQASGQKFTGHYSLHHPLIHVEGTVGDQTGSCDTFNVELDVAGTRA